MSARVGLFFLVPVALFLVAVGIMASFSRAEPVSPLTLYAPCRQLVSTPALWACSNGHSYLRQHGWQDVGQMSPVPKVPSS